MCLIVVLFVLYILFKPCFLYLELHFMLIDFGFDYCTSQLYALLRNFVYESKNSTRIYDVMTIFC